MSSVFKSPKVKSVQPVQVQREIVDDSAIVADLEKKRKKKMGALSQLLSSDHEQNHAYGYKKTLGA